MVATHGNVITHTGTCEACGREGQPLRTVPRRDHEDRDHYSCADEFACFEAWRVRSRLGLIARPRRRRS